MLQYIGCLLTRTLTLFTNLVLGRIFFNGTILYKLHGTLLEENRQINDYLI